MKFKNPIIPGFYPDPSICRVGEDYYLATSSFEYFPGVPLFHSKDLVHWRQIGHCLTRRSQLNLDTAGASGGIYAPTLRYHNGRFYMITTNVSDKGNFYVYTDDIYGDWSEPIWIENKYTGHDPDLFFDDDGKVYYSKFSWDNGILLFEIDIKTGKLLSEEIRIWKGFEDKFPEAPHLYKINGRYYLMVAEGGTARGHMVAIGRSENVQGPYIGCPHNPILSHRAHVCQPLIATGHGDLIQIQNGSWWMVFLAIRQLVDNEYHTLGRETYLTAVTWTKDGWPVVNEGKPVALEMDTGLLPQEHLWEQASERDDFNDDNLELYWNYRFNPIEGSTSLAERKGFLSLIGNVNTLRDKRGVCFVGRRQQDYEFNCSTFMEFNPQNDGEEAGICAFMNENHHYEIAVCRLEGERKVIVRRRIGNLEAIEYILPIATGELKLSIKGDKHSYYLGYSLKDEDISYIAQGDARYLSTEVAGGFTGVYLGMYTTGNGKHSQSLAYFDWFEYRRSSSNKQE
jgi:xylan 1,4-beta-xylosidase